MPETSCSTLRRATCFVPLLLAVISLTLAGCPKKTATKKIDSKDEPRQQDATPASPSGSAASPSDSKPLITARTERQPLSLTSAAPASTSGSSTANASTTSSRGNSSNDNQMELIKQKLAPLQIVLGKWSGKTRRQIKGKVSVEEPEWVWDFRTDRNQPALTVQSTGSPYVRSARLTWLPEKEVFQLKVKDGSDAERTYEGKFAKPVEDVPGEGKRLERTFQLKFDQVQPADEKKMAQIVWNQQENNRYLFQVYDKRGDNFLLFDTIASQRDGTSFAKSLEDYGDKKCIVSGGLGTSTVSFEGKTYYVCCSGCKAAFDEDPKRWIAKAAMADKK